MAISNHHASRATFFLGIGHPAACSGIPDCWNNFIMFCIDILRYRNSIKPPVCRFIFTGLEKSPSIDGPIRRLRGIPTQAPRPRGMALISARRPHPVDAQACRHGKRRVLWPITRALMMIALQWPHRRATWPANRRGCLSRASCFHQADASTPSIIN